MDKDKFKNTGQQKKQRVVNRFLKQRERVNSAEKQQNRVISRENLDTAPQKSKKWLIPGLLAVGVITITSAVVGLQLKAPTNSKTASLTPSTSNPIAESNSSLSNPPGAISKVEQEKEGQMLLEQAKLLANQSQPEKLARAIEIVAKLPQNTAVNSEAQSLAAIWGQKILQTAKNKARGDELSEAIAIAQLIPETNKARQPAQQQIKQWQQQQRQAEDKKFAATLAAVSKLPLSPSAIPQPPPQITPLTQTSKSVSRQSKPVTRTKTSVRNSSASTNVNKTKLKPAVKSQRKTPNNQEQLLARDPYLNVKIPQVSVPQLQAKTVPSSRIVTARSGYGFRNNYGFRNIIVTAPTVAIQLRDNVDEDGDYVSLIVNGKTYTKNQLILNHGKIFMVDLQPGENRVDIVGVKDGQGGITLEVNVAGIGNINNRPIPEGSTASFIINREK